MIRDATGGELPAPSPDERQDGREPPEASLLDREGVLEQIVAECLQRRADGGAESGDAAIDDACTRHPGLAGEIRASLALLDGMGFDGRAPAVTRQGTERMGDYRLLRPLGGGAMGIVYLAEEDQTGRHVALKVVRPEYAFFDRAQRRFRREVETTARLRHPNIVAVQAVGQADGVPFLVMEHVLGCTLADALQQLGDSAVEELSGHKLLEAVRAASESGVDATHADEPFDPWLFEGTWTETCVRIVRGAARALEHAHEQGIHHRDVKPSNIMITPSGRVMLFDFGLAHADDMPRMTQLGAPIGSLAYMSPEQVRGSDDIDHRSDTYSLGVTLYELLTLQLPFAARDRRALETLILAGSPTPPSKLNTKLPRDAETLCLKATEQEPRRRYRDAAAMGADLDNLLTGRPLRARRPGPMRHARYWVTRHPARAALLGLGLASLVYLGRDATLQRTALAEAETSASSNTSLMGLYRQMFETVPLAGVDWADSLDLLAQQTLSLPQDDPARVAGLLELGSLNLEVGRYDESERLLRQVVQDTEQHSGTTSLEHARSLQALARTLLARGDTFVAGQLFGDAMTTVKTLRGSDSALFAELTHDMATAASAAGRGGPALEYASNALRLKRLIHGDETPEAIDSLLLLAELGLRKGWPEHAVEMLDEADALAAALDPNDPIHRDIAFARARQAATERELSRAEPMLRSLIETESRLLTATSPRLRQLQSMLIHVLMQRGRYEEAIQRGHALCETLRSITPDHPALVTQLNRIAKCHLLARQLDERPKALADEALAMLQGTRIDDQGEANLWHTIGTWHYLRGDLASAESAYRRTVNLLSMTRSAVGGAAWGRVHLAMLLEQLGRLDEAQNEFGVAGAALDSYVFGTLPNRQVGTARRLAWTEILGLYYLRTNNPTAARDVLEEAYRSAHNVTPRSSWTADYTGSLLAEALVALDDFERAEELLLTAHVSTREACTDAGDKTQRVVMRLVDLYEAWERHEQAARWRAELRDGAPIPFTRIF